MSDRAYLETLKEYDRLLIVAGLGYLAAAQFGYVTPIWEMNGFGVVATAAVLAAGAGYASAGKIESLLPEPEGIYIVAFRSSDDTGGEIWEVSEDQFANMEVHGSLMQWGVAKRVYECLEYRPKENVAVGNWRESVAGSSIANHYSVADAMEQVEELRAEFEPEAQKSRRLQRRIRSIVRKLDRRRLKDQQEIIDPTTNPEFSDSRATVSEVVEEEVPDDLRPDKLDEPETANGDGGDEEMVGFDLLDDGGDPLKENNE